MAKAYIVDNTATQVVVGACKEVLVTVNLTAAQSVKVIDGIAGTTANVATIATCVIGNVFWYRDFAQGVRIIASGTVDVTVSANTGSTY